MTSTILIIFGQILSGNTQNRKIRPQGLDLGGSTASNQDPEALFPDFEDYDVKICLKFSVTVDRNNFLVYHKTFLLSFGRLEVLFLVFKVAKNMNFNLSGDEFFMMSNSKIMVPL